MSHVTTCMIFPNCAGEAAALYTSVIDDSRIVSMGPTGLVPDAPDEPIVVAIELMGHPVLLMNGPADRFTEAMSLQVTCDTQDEIDRYWEGLVAGGKPSVGGWLIDRFGVHWELVPSILPATMSESPEAGARVNRALFSMQKPDIAALERAARGE